jgi:hypothetical protein
MRDVLETRARYRVSTEIGLKGLIDLVRASGKANYPHPRQERRKAPPLSRSETDAEREDGQLAKGFKEEHEGCHGIRALSTTRVRRNNTSQFGKARTQNIHVPP